MKNKMGVMSCSRNSCENIMCDTYVQSVGYICYSCQSEFKEYLRVNGLKLKNEGQINNELETFMSTPKGTFSEDTETSVDDFFNERTVD